MYVCACFERRRVRDHQRGGDAPPHKNHFGFENQLELGSDLSQLFRHFFKIQRDSLRERRRHLEEAVREGGRVYI
jgi:hypothetical protein